jgi:hypothetical protein
MRTKRRALAALAAALGCAVAVPLILSAVSSASPAAKSPSPAQSGPAPTAAAASGPASIASGTAQRTFVSAGSGSDANPCTRAAPCRNFAAAIAQTAAGGEVIALDSGGYGPVTIGSSISLVAPPGVYAGITAFSGNAITISAGASDVVRLRGLTLTGLGAAVGVFVNSAAAVYVQDAAISGFSTYGIDTSFTNGGATLFVSNTRVGEIGTAGIFLSSSMAPFHATIDGTTVQNGFFGIESSANSTVLVRNSTVSDNSGTGLAANSGAVVAVENTAVTGNGFALASATTMRVSQTTIENNNNGICSCGGQTISFGDNRLAGNASDGSFSSTIGLQ